MFILCCPTLQIRNAELVATQRMEAAEKRKQEEKERRLAQVGRLGLFLFHSDSDLVTWLSAAFLV